MHGNVGSDLLITIVAQSRQEELLEEARHRHFAQRLMAAPNTPKRKTSLWRKWSGIDLVNFPRSISQKES